jgi:trehalose 2-sulfotransferase
MDSVSPSNPVEQYQRVPIGQLRDGKYDQAPVDPQRPGNWFIICTVERCGSHLLGRLLFNAGIGLSLEYFNIRTNVDMRARWGVRDGDHDQYFSELIRHRTMPNGTWGVQLHWSHYRNHPQVIDQRLLPHAKLIYLYRRDLVSQAISLHLARRSGYYGFDGTVTPDVPVDRHGRPRKLGSVWHTLTCARRLRRDTRNWEHFFASRGAAALRIAYEDMVSDQPGAVRKVAEFLGLPATAYRIPSAEPRENKMPEAVELGRKRLAQHHGLLRVLTDVATWPIWLR